MKTQKKPIPPIIGFLCVAQRSPLSLFFLRWFSRLRFIRYSKQINDKTVEQTINSKVKIINLPYLDYLNNRIY
jgi:hypothetical protein